MKKIIIFGTKDLAQLAKYYIENDTNREVAAFCVEKNFRNNEFFEGLPLVNFESVEELYPPEEYCMFAPMTGVKMNKLRERIYNESIAKGYEMFSYISSKASIFTDKIGDNCFIFENNTIQPFVEVGNNVVMWSGNHIGHHSVIEDHTFFTSHVVLSGHCNVKKYSWLGVNSTIRDGVIISEGTLVAMGAMITKDTDSYGLYMGSPAKKQAKNSFEVM